MIGGIVALAIVILGGSWFFLLRDRSGSGGKSSRDDGGIAYQDDDGSTKKTKKAPTDSAEPDTPDSGETSRPGKRPLVLAEVRDEILSIMISASQDPTQNRSKPYCRQATAETYADCGDVAGARSQLERLQDVGRQVPHYQVMPLVAIAWQELKLGETDAAKGTLDDAVKVANLPQYGLETLNIATSLASVLAAAERYEQSREILRDRSRQGFLAEVAADWRAAIDSRSFDIEAVLADKPIPGTVSPQWAAVARGAAWRGFPASALRWAESMTSLELRADAMIAWAEVLVDKAGPDQLAEQLATIETAAAGLGPAGKARLSARLAGKLIVRGQKELGEKWLEMARTTIESLKDPAPLTFSGMKDLYQLSLPDPASLRQGALALAELARAEASLKNKEAAAGALHRALIFLRGTTPSPVAIQARIDEIESRGIAAIRDELKSALGLRSDDQAFRAANQYRRHCASIGEAAQSRVELQTDILLAAVDWGLADEAWSEARTHQNSSDVSQRELYYETALPAVLIHKYRQQGEAEKASAILTIVGEKEEGKETEADLRIRLQRLTEELLAAGKLSEAAREIESYRRIDKIWRLRWTLQLACRLVKESKTEEALEFIDNYEDPIVREIALELTGALASKTGRGRPILELIKTSRLPPTEQVALCRGFLLGLLVPAPTPATAPAKAP